MNVTSSVRRAERPVQIGSRHGYRIEGDVAHINTELSVPPYHPGGAWALELWASEQGYTGGEPSGVKVSEVQFNLPTPLAPHTQRIEARAPVSLPLQGVAHTMLLALVERTGGERRVHDVATYPALETFPAPHFEGEVGYEVRAGEVLLQAGAVASDRAPDNLSGTLSVELWAAPVESRLAPEKSGGHRLAAAQLTPVAGGQSVPGVACRAAFNEPPPGLFRLELLLREWTRALGYQTRDRRTFALPYRVESPASEPALTPPSAPQEMREASEAAAPPAMTEPEASAPQEMREASEAAAPPAVTEPEASAPESVPPLSATVRASSRAVSIQTARVEELARVKGLNLKLAKEIVKSRPFASLDELLRVHGIGRKTLDKLRALLTL